MTAVAAATPARAASATDRRLRLAILVVSVIGIAIASYLTYVHYAGLKVVCLSSGGCETVQASSYAKLGGIPVAVLGLVGYVLIFGSLAIRSDLGRAAGFGIALIGFLFSLYLTYREVFTIKAICQWCVGSAVLMTALVVLTALRLLRAELAPLGEPAFDDDLDADLDPDESEAELPRRGAASRASRPHRRSEASPPAQPR